MSIETQEPQGRLFDIGTVPIEERGFTNPIHEALGIHPDTYTDFPYVEIDIDSNAQIYQWSSRGAYRSKFTDIYQDDWDNEMSWDFVEPNDFRYEGFVQCLTRLDNGDEVLHLIPDITDIDFSIAVKLNDIIALRRYSDNATEVMRMHHECLAGTVQEFGKYAIQIAYLVKNHWPEPDTVYDRA